MREESGGMCGGLCKQVGELIFFEGENLRVGEGQFWCGDIALNFGLLSFFCDDDVCLLGEDFLLGEASPFTGLFLVSNHRKFLFFF